MPECGSQVVLCDVPIRFDTYKGCSHLCKYCFVQKKSDISNISKNETVKALLSFIDGKRTNETKWCDWDIPLHWGGCSDPFQPIERKYRSSFEALKVFVKTQYPFIVSTKGRLIAEPEYLELIKKCNCAVQISAVCREYDRLEPGAPTFEERLEMIKKISEFKRVLVRIQPYMVEVHNSVAKNIERFAEAGAYGIIVEGMKFFKSKKGLIKVGGDICYPMQTLKPRFNALKELAHSSGLKFYAGENRLRYMGDSLCCCGIDGLKGFKGNSYNINHFQNGGVEEPTAAMKNKGSAVAFKAISQSTGESKRLNKTSFKKEMKDRFVNKRDYYDVMFGKADVKSKIRP